MSDHLASREPELLTITEAAELLRAPVATLRYWRHLGTGPRSFRLGRRVLYRSDDHAQLDRRPARRPGLPLSACPAVTAPTHGAHRHPQIVPRPPREYGSTAGSPPRRARRW